ncbi:hypothetical protein QMK61_16495 [Fulvimonas sp. R45]|uniref:hypothetical protein n=1 Tax=Fulvimonas sp. R45 TaxID=3045937 RepID=UPI00265EA1EB|nr:hypothetical protein [Fulvimonas sp. R45]MDO1530438.1 hypothetical protein [Fulvimonas sp. R45]
MKKPTLCAIGILFSLCWLRAAEAGVLVTPQYVVVIAEQCGEGDVACKDVVYTGVDRRTGAALTLRGKALVHMCPDGTTPCRHLGWTFKNGDIAYTVSDDGALDVTRGDKLLLEQKGRWVE